MMYCHMSPSGIMSHKIGLKKLKNKTMNFIVEDNGKPIGFCQYYVCQDSDEPWGIQN